MTVSPSSSKSKSKTPKSLPGEPQTRGPDGSTNGSTAPICKKPQFASKGNKQAYSDNGTPKARSKPPVTLKRVTFEKLREMDFFSEGELRMQSGYDRKSWPLLVVNELVDNSLDACETLGVPPEISLVADVSGITITDNGGGLPPETIKGALDYTVRASDKEAYCSPSRGQLGNALKVLAAMPYVVDPAGGKLLIEAKGIRHEIICAADAVTQTPKIDHRTEDIRDTGGTMVRMEWTPRKNDDGDIVWPFGDDSPIERGSVWRPSIRDSAMSLLWGYAAFNPHLSLSAKWFNESLSFKATNPDLEKWRPNRPMSAHWYDQARFERLLAAYIDYDRKHATDHTVAAFVAELFDGLSATAKRKKVTDEVELSRTNISALAGEHGFHKDLVSRLLAAMKRHSTPVKPARLGVIGRDHFAIRLGQLGCESESIEYAKAVDLDGGLPCVIEAAFGWYGEKGEGQRRMLLAGANWSARLNNPFRSFGTTGEGLDTLLAKQRADAEQPIVFAIHAAHPRIEFSDRGKTSLVVEADSEEGANDES